MKRTVLLDEDLSACLLTAKGQPVQIQRVRTPDGRIVSKVRKTSRKRKRPRKE